MFPFAINCFEACGKDEYIFVGYLLKISTKLRDTMELINTKILQN